MLVNAPPIISAFCCHIAPLPKLKLVIPGPVIVAFWVNRLSDPILKLVFPIVKLLSNTTLALPAMLKFCKVASVKLPLSILVIGLLIFPIFPLLIANSLTPLTVFPCHIVPAPPPLLTAFAVTVPLKVVLP